MDFPHLGDTEFPILSTENVYAFKNTFDYKRWDQNTIVRLVNVLWDGTMNDAPLFDSNDARDSWFDALEDGFAIKLETMARIVPDGYVKVPVPYDVSARYNYLYVEIPLATGDDFIDYERTDGVRRWYFFIDRIEYGAQNTTHMYVSTDYWTTFQNDIAIHYMMLERGHAPVAASSTSKYLSNPIENSELLLAPDVDFGRGSIVRHSRMIPFGNGTKYVVFASMATRENVLSMGRRTGDGESGVWTPPTYSDSEARDGHDLVINGYVWGDGYDYSTLRTTIDNNASNADRLANNATCWAIPADECFGFRDETYYDSFLVKLARQCPSFLQTIMAMFVVDESMISFNYDPVYVCGHALRYCRGTTKQPVRLELTQEMFDIPTRYQRYAKLYTFPYSLLELTDNDGKTVSVRIEDTGEISYQLITSVAYPLLDMRVLFSGIGGNGTPNRYTWTNLVGERGTIDIGADDWGSVKFDWPIPTFGLYMDGEAAYNLRNWGNLKNARIDAVSAYHATMRDANCAKNNATALAGTAQTNATDTANTQQSNANDSADTLVANTANTCNAQTANTALTVAANTANVARGNQTSVWLTAQANEAATRKTGHDNALMAVSARVENETSIATTANSGNAAIATGFGNGVMSSTGMAMGLAEANPLAGVAALAVGGAMGAAMGGITAQTNNENALIVTQANSSVTSNTISTNSAKVAITNGNNTLATDEMNDCKEDQNDNTNNCLTGQTANNVDAATRNAANTSATMKGNAARSRNTAVGNAGRTHDTTVSNAGYTQIASERTAKELLEAAQRKAKNSYESARNQAPTRVGQTSGDPTADYFRTRGVQVKVRTESESAIAQAGDQFARYGYALNRMWDVDDSGFCPMKRFCYWKASDIWVDDRMSSNGDASKSIQRMFLEGVTLWKNPEEIGRVSVYDN